MKRSWLAVVLGLTLTMSFACGGGAEEAVEEEPAENRGLVLPDTTIVRELNTRLDVDPRLDNPEITLEAHSTDGEVTLVGVVPSRYELSIAMEVARSTPGVHQVWLDSVRVLSENVPENQGEAETSTEQS